MTELTIIAMLFLILAMGICGGIICAYIFDLEPRERRRRARIARRMAREKNRKKVNFTIDFF